jgi:hypothetical protein
MIFALAIAGLLSAISSLNAPAIESFDEVQAAYVGKQVMEDLRLSIDADTWDNGDSPLVPTGPGAFHTWKTFTLQGLTFNAFYNVVDDATSGGRWVDLTVEWTD